MKRILVSLTLFVIAFVVVTGGLALMAEQHPFRPGQGPYAAQNMAEQIQLRLALGPTRQADAALDLAYRRLADLSAATTPRTAEAAIIALNAALDRAVAAVAAAPAGPQDRLYGRLNELLLEADTLLADIAESGLLAADDAGYAALRNKVSALMVAQNINAVTAIAGTLQDGSGTTTPIDAAAISFLGQVDHSFFPLTNAHEQASCTACHQEGRYEGTPTNCLGCHETDKPADHFPGECSDCHTLTDWTPFQFDHRSVTECAACHTADAPAGHYPEECALCHTNTTDWSQFTFDHAGVTACQSCHEPERPADHFPGECAACHADISDWTQASFDHAGVADCASCHANDKPANHFPGECITCHTNTQDWTQASFNHSGFTDCQSCHTSDKPANHYPGQCSTCHTSTSDWGRVSFNHSG
ncbi:MAG: cytochrome c3 family protein, partial [Anaerolineales bacterium]|nr:cytochrome c3 family protein [Anaerolineales bacterium]